MRTTYTNFADVAKVLGFKVKKQVVKKEATRKCPECGNDLRHIEGTNVWVCDMFLLEEKELKGTPVQVFKACGQRVLEGKEA